MATLKSTKVNGPVNVTGTLEFSGKNALEAAIVNAMTPLGCVRSFATSAAKDEFVANMAAYGQTWTELTAYRRALSNHSSGGLSTSNGSIKAHTHSAGSHTHTASHSHSGGSHNHQWSDIVEQDGVDTDGADSYTIAALSSYNSSGSTKYMGSKSGSWTSTSYNQSEKQHDTITCSSVSDSADTNSPQTTGTTGTAENRAYGLLTRTVYRTA